MSNAAANWYPDPDDSSQYRYWDGTQWTDHRAPRGPAEAAVQPAADSQGAEESPVEWWGLRTGVVA